MKNGISPYYFLLPLVFLIVFNAGKGEAGGGFLPEVWGGLCGYGAEDSDLRDGGRTAAGGAVRAVQGHHPAHPDPENHHPV